MQVFAVVKYNHTGCALQGMEANALYMKLLKKLSDWSLFDCLTYFYSKSFFSYEYRSENSPPP
jgi:hypothetical protein